MTEDYIQKAYELLKVYRRITPVLLMRTLHINGHLANEICNKIWFRMHLEARKLAKEIENS